MTDSSDHQPNGSMRMQGGRYGGGGRESVQGPEPLTVGVGVLLSQKEVLRKDGERKVNVGQALGELD